MTLNVSETTNSPSTRTSRLTITRELVEELSSWNPRQMIAAYRRLHRGGVSLIHLHVLALLELDGSLPMGRLAEALDVSVASATGIVGRMESRGLVERRHDEHDRRIVLVHSTDAGRDVFRELDDRRREALTEVLDRLTDDEMAGLLAGHRALRAARSALVEESAE